VAAIGNRFRDVPDQLLVFEVLNESEARHIDALLTTEMNERILRVIRETNPSRCVIIGPWVTTPTAWSRS